MRRFYEVQCVLLAPICPHFCEFVWQDLLGHAATVTRAPWPVAAPVNELVLRQHEYLQGRLHAFRVAITKQFVGKPKAGKAAVASVKPTHLNIYVASRFSPMQQFVLGTLAPLFDASAHAASGGFPSDVLVTLKAALLGHAAYKPQIKAGMELASLLVAEQKERAEPLPQLRGELPLDEFATWSSNIPLVQQSLDIATVTVLRIEDDGVLATDASNKAKDVVPGSPSIYAYVKE